MFEMLTSLRLDFKVIGNSKMRCYPHPEEILSRQGDKELLRIYRSFRSLIPILLFFFAVLAASIFATFVASHPALGSLLKLSSFSQRWFVLPPILVLLEIFRRRYNDLYVIGRESLFHYGGRISLNYYIHVIKFTDIRAVNVHKDFWGRVFNYGTIEVCTAAQLEGEVFLYGVKHPEEIASILDHFRTENSTRHAQEAKRALSNDGE